MGLPAARNSELHVCPAFSGLIPHLGGPVLVFGSGRVETNGDGAAHAGHTAICVLGPTDFVVTGSGTVTIGGKPAARKTDHTMHGGSIVEGTHNVVIGGPTVGITLGDPEAGAKACAAAAAGRASGLTKQSYSNCGVETTRQIINQATGKNLGEDELLKSAVARGQAYGDTSPDKIGKAGGSWPGQREPMLEENGVPAERVPGTMDNLTQAVAQGKGVEVDVWAGTLWPPESGYKPGTGPHVVLATGIAFDANGRMTSVIINDTGRGACGKAYAADTFEDALMGDDHVVTKGSIW